MMKSIFKGMFVLAALALPTTINAQKLHYNAGLETSHLWRGLEVSKGLTFNNEFAISDNNNHFRLGAWGGMQVDGDYKEADIYASYTIGGFSVAVWDIYNFSDGIYANDKQYRYFNYDARTTGHFLDAAISYNFAQHGLPLTLSWATVLAGAIVATSTSRTSTLLSCRLPTPSMRMTIGRWMPAWVATSPSATMTRTMVPRSMASRLV